MEDPSSSTAVSDAFSQKTLGEMLAHPAMVSGVFSTGVNSESSRSRRGSESARKFSLESVGSGSGNSNGNLSRSDARERRGSVLGSGGRTSPVRLGDIAAVFGNSARQRSRPRRSFEGSQSGQSPLRQLSASTEGNSTITGQSGSPLNCRGSMSQATQCGSPLNYRNSTSPTRQTVQGGSPLTGRGSMSPIRKEPPLLDSAGMASNADLNMGLEANADFNIRPARERAALRGAEWDLNMDSENSVQGMGFPPLEALDEDFDTSSRRATYWTRNDASFDDVSLKDGASFLRRRPPAFKHPGDPEGGPSPMDPCVVEHSPMMPSPFGVWIPRVDPQEKAKDLLRPEFVQTRLSQINKIIHRRKKRALFAMDVESDETMLGRRSLGQTTIRKMTTMQEMLARVRRRNRTSQGYTFLLLFICFFTNFLFTMFWKFDGPKNMSMQRSIETQLLSVLPDLYIKDDTQFYDWFDRLVSRIFKPPTCGNGECESPEEFPSVGRFGCQPDCGRVVETSRIRISLSNGLSSVGDEGWDLREGVASSGLGLESSFTFNVWSETLQAYMLEKDSANTLQVMSVPDGKYRLDLFHNTLLTASQAFPSDLLTFARVSPATLPPRDASSADLAYGMGRDAVNTAVSFAKSSQMWCAGLDAIEDGSACSAGGQQVADRLLQQYGLQGTIVMARDSSSRAPQAPLLTVRPCAISPQAQARSATLPPEACASALVKGTAVCRDASVLVSDFVCPSSFSFEIAKFSYRKAASTNGGDDAASAALARTLVPFNSMIGSLVVYQTRRKEVECAKVPERLRVSVERFRCEIEDIETPFGTDPSFFLSSVLYSGKSPVNQAYSPLNEVRNETLLPYAFFPHQWGKDDSQVLSRSYGRYYVFFDGMLASDQASQRSKFLREAGFIDDFTATITVEMLVLNAQYSAMGKFIISFAWDTAGNIMWTRRFQMANLGAYAGDDKYTNWFTDGLYLGQLLMDIVHTMWGLHIAVKKEQLKNYFQSSIYIVWVHLALLIVVYSLWSYNISWAGNTTFPENWNVIADRKGMLRPFATNPDVEASILGMSFTIEDLCEQARLIWALNVFCTFGFMARIIILLDFQPRLALISKTVSEAWQDLGHFFLLFALLCFAYGGAGTILLGPKVDEFQTIHKSIQVLIQIFMGTRKNYYQLVQAVNASNSQGIQYAFAFFYSSWFVLMRMMMFNICAAIIVSTFERVQAKFKGSRTVFADFSELSYNVALWFKQMFGRKKDIISDKEIEHVLRGQMNHQKITRVPTNVLSRSMDTDANIRLRVPGGITVAPTELAEMLEMANIKHKRRSGSFHAFKKVEHEKTEYIDGVEIASTKQEDRRVHPTVEDLVRRYGAVIDDEKDDQEMMRLMKIEQLMISLSTADVDDSINAEIREMLEVSAAPAEDVMPDEAMEELQQSLLILASQHDYGATISIGDLLSTRAFTEGLLHVTVVNAQMLPTKKTFSDSNVKVVLLTINPPLKAEPAKLKGPSLVNSLNNSPRISPSSPRGSKEISIHDILKHKKGRADSGDFDFNPDVSEVAVHGETKTVSGRVNASWNDSCTFRLCVRPGCLLLGVVVDADANSAIGAFTLDLEAIPVGQSAVQCACEIAGASARVQKKGDPEPLIQLDVRWEADPDTTRQTSTGNSRTASPHLTAGRSPSEMQKGIPKIKRHSSAGSTGEMQKEQDLKKGCLREAARKSLIDNFTWLIIDLENEVLDPFAAKSRKVRIAVEAKDNSDDVITAVSVIEGLDRAREKNKHSRQGNVKKQSLKAMGRTANHGLLSNESVQAALKR